MGLDTHILNPEVAIDAWNSFSSGIVNAWDNFEGFINAVYHATTINAEMGLGIGGSFEKGIISAEFAYRDAMFSTLDSSGWTGWHWDTRSEANAHIAGFVGVKFEDGRFVPYVKAFGEGTLTNESDLIIAIGKTNYMYIIGGGIELQFNLSEFDRRLGVNY